MENYESLKLEIESIKKSLKKLERKQPVFRANAVIPDDYYDIVSVRCAFCWQYLAKDDAKGESPEMRERHSQIVAAHIQGCEKHPFYLLRNKYNKLLASMNATENQTA